MTTAQVTFKGVDHSDAVVDLINEKFEKLQKLDARITNCHVTVTKPHKHHHKGALFDVHIDVHVPGHEFNASREAPDGAHEDPYVTVRDAFSAIEKQMKTSRAKETDHRR